MMREIYIISILMIIFPEIVLAQGYNYKPLPAGTKCVVVNSTNNGTINLTCNSVRIHDNGIKQDGYEVGLAEGFAQSSKSVTFSKLSGGNDFDPKKEFIYREKKMRIVGYGVAGSTDSAGEHRVIFWNVVCQVMG